MNIDVRMRFKKRLRALFPVLQASYEKRRPEFGNEGYKQRVFDRIDKYSARELDLLIPETLIIARDKLEELLLESEAAPLSIDLQYIYAATAYGIKSKRVAELEYERMGAAWDLLAQASFELGWAACISHGDELLDITFGHQVRQENSKNAANKQHSKRAEVRKWGLEFVRQHAPWPSQGSANTALEIALKEKYGEAHFKDFRGTIKKWLQNMEDREKYFKSLDLG